MTRVEVRWAVACPTPDAARRLLATAAAVSVAEFRDALAGCASGEAWRTLGIADEAAHLWRVAEVVDVAAPQLVAGAFCGVAGAIWTRNLDLDAARAHPRVLLAAFAVALDVAAADVTFSVRDAANERHAAALARAPLVSAELQFIPATGGLKVLDAFGDMLDAHFAAPSSSEEDEDGDAAAAAAPLLPLDRERIFLQGFLGDHKRRLKTLVESLGGAVVGRAASPTLAIFPDSERSHCHRDLYDLRERHRIVRERWLDGVLAGEPLPDFRPHAVYAQVCDVRDPRSYFYGAVPDADLVKRKDTDWKVIPEDWTPAAGADGGAT